METTLRALIVACILFFCLSLSLSGQAWHGLKQHDTQKFRIVYEEAYSEYAQELALWADKVYEEAVSWLALGADNDPFKRNHPILVFISDRGDLFNAFQTEDWIHLFPTPPLNPLFKHSNWLQLVFAHELTHYITFNYRPSIWQGWHHFIEPYVYAFIAFNVSGNLVEGATVFAESNIFDVSRSGRGHNPFFELVMRSIILDDRYPNYWQSLAPSYRDSDPSLEALHYLVGYYFYNYLEQEYGPKLIQRVWQAFHKNLVGNEAALETITGKTIQQLYDEMRNQLRQRFFANGAQLQRRENIFAEDAHYGLPIFTEKGVVVVQKKLNNQRSLLFGDRTSQLSQKEWPAFTLELSANKDGSILVADDYFFRNGVNVFRGLGVYQDGRWSLLDKERGLGEAALSPDGQILLASKVKAQDFSLVRVDMETGVSEELLAFEGVAFNQPVWNKDGDKFLLRLSARHEELSELWEFSWPMLDARFLYSSTTKTIEQAFYDKSNNVYFISDYQNHPAVVKLEQNSEQTTLKVVAEDRIGILQATWDNKSSLYYQSYEKGRRVIKKIPTEQLVAEPYLLEAKKKGLPKLFKEQLSPQKPQLQNRDAEDLIYGAFELSQTVLAFSNKNYGAVLGFRSLLGLNINVGLLWHLSGQPKPSLKLSFSPLNAFGYLPADFTLSYTIERVVESPTLGLSQIFGFSFTPFVARLGTGVSFLSVQSALQWLYLETYKNTFTVFEAIPARVFTYHYWIPQLVFSWIWDRQWGSGTGAGVTWLNRFPLLDYTLPDTPLQQIGYETALNSFYDLPLFDDANLQLQANASFDTQGGGAENNLNPPVGWEETPYRESADFSIKYGLVLSMPFYFTQDKPFLYYALHSWDVAVALAVKNNMNFDTPLNKLLHRYELYLGGRLGLEIRENRLILPRLDLEIGWLALRHQLLPVNERWSFALKFQL